MTEIPKMDLKSMDIAEDKKQQLKQIFPEVFTEKKIDFEKLKSVLGEMIETGRERYGMNWPGKADCMKIIQRPSVGTLKPCPEESIDFDNTENLFIEGDNLEVLKLLQKSYYGKVKMIYIDPPYNTGNDFVYPDDYSETLDTYLKYTGQVDDEGKKFSTNVDSDGRFHSKWMNMMYPRLYLARNLLKEDGLIFISINDKEVSNLKIILNDIFGEENFISQLIWDKNHSAQAGVFKVYHEYVFVFAKNLEFITTPKSSDNDNFEAGAMKKESKRHPMQKFKFPKGAKYLAPNGTELKEQWGDVEKVILHEGRMISDNGYLKEDVVLEAGFTQMNQMQKYFYGDKENLIDSRGQKIVEFYFTATGKLKIVKERSIYTPPTVCRWGTQGDISKSLAELFNMSDAPLDTPKNPKMVIDFATWFTNENDIILDFFGGSSASAEAVLKLNKETNEEDRKFIIVQLPEVCSTKTEAYKAGYKTIADIGKERIRRVIKKIKEEKSSQLDFDKDKNLDLGFKVFKLDNSNFKVWNGESKENQEDFTKQLELHIDHIHPTSTQEDILYELLLKAGFPLTTKIEKLNIQDKTVFSIADGALFICLEKDLSKELIKAMADKSPIQVICLDAGFHGNDQLKTNAVQIMKTKEIEFRTV